MATIGSGLPLPAWNHHVHVAQGHFPPQSNLHWRLTRRRHCHQVCCGKMVNGVRQHLSQDVRHQTHPRFPVVPAFVSYTSCLIPHGSKRVEIFDLKLLLNQPYIPELSGIHLLIPHVIHKQGLWQVLLFKFHRPALFHYLFKQDPSRQLP